MPTANNITGCILAGGQGRRLDGLDKGLLPFGTGTLIEHCIARLQPQVSDVIISANRNHAAYASFSPTVFSDSFGDYAGPLAGFVTAMALASQPFIVTAACDSPFIPHDMVERLSRPVLAGQADISVACCAGQLQPVFGLFAVDLRASLIDYLNSGERKITTWFKQHRLVEVSFADPDAFANINTLADLENARQRLKQYDSGD